MSIITKVLRQKAVYWPPGDRDKYGRNTFGSPVEIKCRWDDKIQEVVQEDGSETMSVAEVMVDRDLAVGGVLLLGELDTEKENATRPDLLAGASFIGTWEKNPNLKATEFVRTVYMVKG